jgi:sarcosine oxidase delta subunit
MMKKTDKIAELKRASDAMYAEYLNARDTDKGAADFAWEQYQSFVLQIERLEAK